MKGVNGAARRPTSRPRLYFSFRSPYSWLTVQRLLAAVPDAAQAFDWFPFWDPDPLTLQGLTEREAELHYVQMSRAKHLYLLLDTKRLAEGLGLSMAWPVDVDPWWELPHLAYLVARRQGRGLDFYQEITRARWGRGDNVCTPQVVHAAAVAAGVDPAAAVGAPDDPAVRQEGVGCLQAAYQDDVFGIPYLRWGRHRYWGYERLDMFLALWLGAAGETAPAVPPSPAAVLAGAGYDTDTPGGCG